MNSDSQKPHDSTISFFIDRSLGKIDISQRLRKEGFTVEIHDDYFSENTSDSEWLSFVGKKGWIVLTKDKRIRHRENEKFMVKENKVGMFVLTKGDYTSEEMGNIILKAVVKIQRFVSTNKPPFIVSITKSSNLNRLL